ncbi:hypothetical protein HYU93_03400 [Candidatus Daviesbacteria bacterium]|nr:hypothetical protein [Candidatus Daviesbacteria bacterium]
MKKYFFLHPIFFSLYPAIFLYSQNINQYKENVLLIPILLSLAFLGLISSVCWLVIRKLEISAVASSLLILIFFSYSRVKELAKSIKLTSDILLSICLLVIFIFLIFLVFRYQKYLHNISRALSILSVILIIMVLSNNAFFEVQIKRLSLLNLESGSIPEENSEIAGQKPDIYYFVLDRYAGAEVLKQYGFDNNPFLDFLKSKGFYIASEATSNYPKTFLSLGSTLNMEYLNFLTEKTNGGATSDESIVTPLVQNGKVIQLLKSKGYSYIHVGSGWDPTRSNPKASQNFVLKGGRYPFADEFTSGFLQTTLASPILTKLYPDPTAVSEKPKNNEERSRILYEFEVFNQIINQGGPKFVFTHILIPHDPYVLGKDCEPLPETVTSKSGEKENYLNQLQCANKKMEEVLTKILASSSVKPVILIQADEGPLPILNPISKNLAWKNASDQSLKEKFPILTAYLLPGNKNNVLYPAITPVNSFRLIFNTYFGTNLPLLPDRNIIFEDDKNYYKFIDVTEKLKTNTN